MLPFNQTSSRVTFKFAILVPSTVIEATPMGSRDTINQKRLWLASLVKARSDLDGVRAFSRMFLFNSIAFIARLAPRCSSFLDLFSHYLLRLMNGNMIIVSSPFLRDVIR
jgi:hypothetical protein